jgi:hypothetical protein
MPRALFVPLCVAMLATSFGTLPVLAATTDNWTDGTGNWSTAANWTNTSSGHTVPAAGDTVNIVDSDGVSRTITYNYTGAAITLGTVTIDLTGGTGAATNTLSMSANNLTAALEIVGANGAGAFTQSGGANSVTGTDSLAIGLQSAAVGTYTLSGGSLAISGNFFVGDLGTGTFTQTAGTNTVTVGSNYFLIGAVANSNGTYNLSGTGAVSAGDEYVGDSGTGAFNQSGGTNTLATGHSLYLGFTAGSSGTYTLSGAGSLSVSNFEYVGDSSTGTFNQIGGTNTVQNLYLGQAAGSSGMYTLSGGTLNGNNEAIGVSGSATFNHSGGTNNAGSLVIGNGSSPTSPSATYNLSGTGVLNVDGVLVGATGTANLFNQTGGTLTNYDELDLGFFPGTSGTYTLSGGSSSNNYFGVWVGGSSMAAGGTGVLNVSGTGVLSVSGLTIYNTSGTSVNLSGGTINAYAVNFNGAPSRFNWTSGELNVIANVAWDSAAAGTSTAAIFGSALTLGNNQALMVTGNETLGGSGVFALTLNSGSTHNVTGNLTISPTGTITQNDGSTLNAATITQAGGTVNGTLQNQGNFIYQSGQFNGRLLNQGTVNLGANFTAPNGVENDASMTIALGQTLTLNGAGLDNQGNLTLAGGIVNGAGPLANNALLSGTGTLGGSGGFTNNGELSVSGGNFTLSNSNSNSNAGTIDLSAGLQLKLTGGDLANTGVINLNGGIVSGTATLNNTTGTINGHGTISSVFTSNAGLLVVDSGTLSVASAFANSGEILLNGGDATLNSGTVTNTGLIRGDGFITNAVNNNFGGEIRAEDGKRLKFAGVNDTNLGTINLQGGTAEFAQPLTNGANTGQIVGRGTLIVDGTGLTNNGNIAFSSGITDVFGDVHNSTGSTTQGITISGNAAVTFWDDVTNGVTAGDGTLFKVSSGSSATFFGTYSGTGVSGTGNVYYEADISPGFSPASVNYGGNVFLDSTSRLIMQLGGTTVGTQYDKVNVAGQLALGGTLDVELINSFSPASGNKFDILDWGSLSGHFSSVGLPALSAGLAWNSAQLYTIGTLEVVNVNLLPGDFNRDGHVDASDILPAMKALTDPAGYEAQYSVSPADLQIIGDVNGDTKFTNADLQALLNYLQDGGGSISTVPEPSGLLLLALGSFALTVRRRIDHKARR